MAMSNYFKYFPTMEYDIKNDGNLVRVKDLFNSSLSNSLLDCQKDFPARVNSS